MTSNQCDAIIIGRGITGWPPRRGGRMEITLKHHRQHAPAKVVKLPFYEPEWKRK